jgi:hypothetical protein
MRKRNRKGKGRKTICACGKPNRAGQGDCLTCHSLKMKSYRETKKQKTADHPKDAFTEAQETISEHAREGEPGG